MIFIVSTTTKWYLEYESLSLLGLDLAQVELELFAFENVSVASTALSGSRRHTRCNTTHMKDYNSVTLP